MSTTAIRSSAIAPRRARALMAWDVALLVALLLIVAVAL
jgi:hypothetical protein